MNKFNPELCGLRLKIIRESLGLLNQADFARKFGINQATVSKYEKGQVQIPDEIKVILSENGINIHWLLTGEGEMFISGSKEEEVALTTAENKSVSSSYKVPLLRQKVSCGTGVDWRSDDNVDKYVDVFEFIPGLALVHPYALLAEGSSMAGFGIRDGDIIFFDSRPDQVIREDVYIFALDGDVFCKRIEIDRMKKTLYLLSMRNTSDVLHAELWQTLKTDDANFTDRFHLFGRVVAWLHVNGMLERN